jgi:3-deoxy-D-manno-octulosonate 8-phosphate phosphatase (KDO 8-P phosphatase)
VPAPILDLDEKQRAHLAAAKLLVLDVDGTLTDGRVVYIGGEESQAFCVRDGQGLVWLHRAGVKLAWISGRGSEPTRRRAEELGIDHVSLRCRDKTAALQRAQAELGVGPAETIAMGDDLPDLALAAGSAFFAAPRDARREVRERADLVVNAVGGSGAVRELCEACLRAKDLWQGIVGAADR